MNGNLVSDQRRGRHLDDAEYFRATMLIDSNCLHSSDI